MPPISRAPRGPPASTTLSASKVPHALSTTYRPPRSSTPSTSHISNRSTASSPSTAKVALRAATGGWTYPSSAVYVAPTKRAQFRSGKRRLPSSGSTHSFSTPRPRPNPALIPRPAQNHHAPAGAPSTTQGFHRQPQRRRRPSCPTPPHYPSPIPTVVLSTGAWQPERHY